MKSGAIHIREAITNLDLESDKKKPMEVEKPKEMSSKYSKHSKYSKTAQKIKSASLALKEARSRFKTAMDEGTISPEDAKEISEEITEMAVGIAEAASLIVEGVPAEEHMETPMGEEEETSVASPISQSQTDDDDEKDKPMEEKVAKLERELTAMKLKEAKSTLATKYASLFPEQTREKVAQEFNKRTDTLPILEGQVREAQSILSGKIYTSPKPAKFAQQESEALFAIGEDDSTNNDLILPGGKW